MDSAESASGDATGITELLQRWSAGDAEAQERLIPLVYEECRRIAERQLRSEESGHTLEPTALVHELYLRLVGQRSATWQNRAHFYGVAAQIMRRILVDHARAKRTRKRGANRVMMSLTNVSDASSATDVADIIAIDDLLTRLGAQDPEQQRIVELRFFAGLTVEETALVVGRSPRTVKREWQLAKAWLYRELRK